MNEEDEVEDKEDEEEEGEVDDEEDGWFLLSVTSSVSLSAGAWETITGD